MLRDNFEGPKFLTDANAETAIYIEVAHRARLATIANLSSVFGEFNVTEWSNRAFDGLWASPTFPWDRINRSHRDPDRLEIAIWVGKRLVCMALALSDGDDVVVKFLEGDPAPDCPLRVCERLLR